MELSLFYLSSVLKTSFPTIAMYYGKFHKNYVSLKTKVTEIQTCILILRKYWFFNFKLIKSTVITDWIFDFKEQLMKRDVQKKNIGLGNVQVHKYIAIQ